MEYYLEHLKNMKVAYDEYSRKLNLTTFDMAYKGMLADRIIQTQDYIIEKLLEEKKVIKEMIYSEVNR